MASSQQELLTTIHAAQAELELMAGYEESYPEHYAELKKVLKQATDAYARAMKAQLPYAPKEAQQESQPQEESRPPAASNGARHVAVQDTIMIAGRGDRIVFLHCEEAEEGETTAATGAGNAGGQRSNSPAPTKPSSPTTGRGSTGAEQTAPSEPDDFPAGPPKRQSQGIEKVQADAWKQGYDGFHLRNDVARVYNKIRQEVTQRGAILTSSGGLRSLDAAAGAGRSATSFHYTGRALDLFIYSGMVDPKTDPYVVVRERARVYRVYARCSADQADVSELSQVMTYHKRDGSLSASGSFIDLTAIFERHGFARIPARSNFESGGNQLGAEWWHFQCERGLTRGQSTFGEELLAMYSEKTLAPSAPWEYRNYVFGVNWN